MTIQININDNTPAPLYAQYDGQINPQPAYLEFDPSREELALDALYSGEIGNSVPMAVWHKRILRFSVPSDVSRDALEALAENEEVERLLSIIRDGYECAWDGSNWVGRYTEAAQDTLYELERLFSELDRVDVWDAADYVADSIDWIHLAEHGIAEEVRSFEDCKENDVAVFGGITEAIVEAAEYRVRRHIDTEIVGDDTIRRLAVILAEHDADEHQELLDDYIAEFGSDDEPL